jgi:hypothetical protein
MFVANKKPPTKRYFDEVLKKHVKELAETDNFTFELLNIRLSHITINSVNEAFEVKIKELKDAGHVGNSTVYEFIKKCF